MKQTPLQQAIDELRYASSAPSFAEGFINYHNRSRGLGNTISCIEGCKARNSTLICHNTAFARSVHREHGIKTTTLFNNDFAERPTEAIMDNAVIAKLAEENLRLRALATKLLDILHSKNIY